MLEKSKYFQYLVPSAFDEVEERINDFVWIDEYGIICSVPKEVMQPMSKSEIFGQIADWDEKHGVEKRKMITVVNPHVKSTKEERDFTAELLPKYVKALAVINDSALGRMAIKLFLGLRPPVFPLKVFKNGDEAKKWLLTID